MSKPKLEPVMATQFPGPDPGAKVRAVLVYRKDGLWCQAFVEFDADIIKLGRVIRERSGLDMGGVVGYSMSDLYEESQRG